MILGYKGISIFYEVQGKGETLVLLHGLLENSSMWNTIVPEICQGRQVVTIDLLGHGKTGSMGYVHTMQLMAEAVFAVLNHLKIISYTLIGHSLGGYVALELAKTNPSAVLGLCLMNSTYQPDTQERRKLRKRAIDMAKTNYESLVRISFVNLFSSESKEHYKAEIDQALIEALKTPVQGFISAQEGMYKRRGMLDFFKKLKANKMIILGRDDGLMNAEIIDQQIERTDIAFHKITGGHMSHIENNKEFTYLIKQFIEN